MISTRELNTSIPLPLLKPAGLTIQILLCPLISYYGSESLSFISTLSALSLRLSFSSSLSLSSFYPSVLFFFLFNHFFSISSFFLGSMYNQVVLQSIFFIQSECFYFYSYFESISSLPMMSHSYSSTNCSGKSFISIISSKVKAHLSQTVKAVHRTLSSICSTSW